MGRALREPETEPEDDEEYEEWKPEEWTTAEWADEVLPHLTEAIDNGKLDDYLQEIARACRLRYFNLERKGGRNKPRKNSAGIVNNSGRFENSTILHDDFVIGRDGLVPVAIRNFPDTSKALVGSFRAFGNLYLKKNLADRHFVVLSDYTSKKTLKKLYTGTLCKVVQVSPNHWIAVPVIAAPGRPPLTAEELASKWRFNFVYNEQYFDM